ncbi:MAG: PAS domain S-box protein [Ignavibacteria bacterium]|nr:PAS domain S-box protein [Ignavibacteria bacterium]
MIGVLDNQARLARVDSSVWSRWVIVIGALSIHTLLFIPSTVTFGVVSGVFLIVPAALAGWWFGIKGGFVAGVAGTFLHCLLLIVGANAVPSDILHIIPVFALLPTSGVLAGMYKVERVRVRGLEQARAIENEKFQQAQESWKSTEEELRELEREYSAMVMQARDGILILQDDTIVFANRSLSELAGYASTEDIRRIPYLDVIAEESRVPFRQYIEARMRGEQVTPCFEAKLRTKSGEVLDVEITITSTQYYMRSASLGVVRDITEKKRDEQRLRDSLREKEVMLKEIHHRVKNNLQVISSLLSLQSDTIEDPVDQELFKESENRVRSMAVIHEKLYQSKDLALIDFGDYLLNITSWLFRSYHMTERVTCTVVAQDVSLGIDAAIPCGLIINELVSNALKYAFPDGREGKLSVVFARGDEGQLRLTVSDDGIGMASDISMENSKTLGLRLISILIRQLGGTVQLDGSNGTTFRIEFANH